jgi:hypothetical protein
MISPRVSLLCLANICGLWSIEMDGHGRSVELPEEIVPTRRIIKPGPRFDLPAILRPDQLVLVPNALDHDSAWPADTSPVSAICEPDCLRVGVSDVAIDGDLLARSKDETALEIADALKNRPDLGLPNSLSKYGIGREATHDDIDVHSAFAEKIAVDDFSDCSLVG